MNNNYFPVGKRLPSRSTLSLIEQAYKDHDEKLLGENLKIIMSRGLNNTSSDASWVLASNAGVELSKQNGQRVAVFEVDGFDTHAAQGETNGAEEDWLDEYRRIEHEGTQSME